MPRTWHNPASTSDLWRPHVPLSPGDHDADDGTRPRDVFAPRCAVDTSWAPVGSSLPPVSAMHNPY